MYTVHCTLYNVQCTYHVNNVTITITNGSQSDVYAFFSPGGDSGQTASGCLRKVTGIAACKHRVEFRDIT